MCSDAAGRWQPCWRLGQSRSAAVHVWATTAATWLLVAPALLRPLDHAAIGAPLASVPSVACRATADTTIRQATAEAAADYAVIARGAFELATSHTWAVGDSALWCTYPPGQGLQHQLVTVSDVSGIAAANPLVAIRVQWSGNRHAVIAVHPDLIVPRFDGDQPLRDPAVTILQTQGLLAWPTVQTAGVESDAVRPDGTRVWPSGWACPQRQPTLRPVDAAVCTNSRVPAGRAEQMRTVHRQYNPMIPSVPVDPRTLLRTPLPRLPPSVAQLE